MSLNNRAITELPRTEELRSASRTREHHTCIPFAHAQIDDHVPPASGTTVRLIMVDLYGVP